MLIRIPPEKERGTSATKPSSIWDGIKGDYVEHDDYDDYDEERSDFYYSEQSFDEESEGDYDEEEWENEDEEMKDDDAVAGAATVEKELP